MAKKLSNQHQAAFQQLKTEEEKRLLPRKEMQEHNKYLAEAAKVAVVLILKLAKKNEKLLKN